MPSLGALSTELDDRILSFMEHSSLKAMSRVSKYYRKVAEPHLYREICIDKRYGMRIKLLFFALVTRLELAGHIRSFYIIGSHSSVTDLEDETFSRPFLETTMDMKEIVSQAQGQLPVSQQLKWLASILTPSKDTVDTYLALILSLAKNVELIWFTTSSRTHDYQSFRRVTLAIASSWMPLAQPIIQSGSGNDGVGLKSIEDESVSESVETTHIPTTISAFSGSFIKLRSMKPVRVSKLSIPIVPSLDTFGLYHGEDNTIQWPTLPQGGTALHAIDFRECDLPQTSLIVGLKAGYLKKVLVVRFLGTWYHEGISQHHELAEAMAANMPSLECLDWVDFLDPFGSPPSSPLKHFTQFLNLTHFTYRPPTAY